MVIVYNSNAGHSERYAHMLGEKLKIDAIPYSEIKKVDINEEVIYIGWVFASKITKLEEVQKKYNVICAIAVGMNFKSDDNTQIVIETNKINIPFFYLQGGLEYSKLKGIKKFIMKMVSESVIKENKEENKELIEIFKNGGDFVKEENLDEIITYFRNK